MAVINLAQVASPSAPSASTDNIFIDTSGNLSVQKPDGNIVKLAAAGTFTLTIPATGTAALLGTAQTFSEAQTFSSVITAPGMKPASNSTTALEFENAGGTAILTVDTTNSRVLADSLRTGSAAVNDDTALTLTGGGTSGIIFLSTTAANDWGVVKYRGRASSPHATLVAGGTLFAVTTSDVTGTTGTDGRLTFSATTDNLKVENRTGASATITWFFIN
jgi:hypothetical protein